VRAYRFYALKYGHVIGPADLVDCENDDDAVQKARSRIDGVDLEVWEGTRLVIKLKSQDE
jgi:hypothetical protein